MMTCGMLLFDDFSVFYNTDDYTPHIAPLIENSDFLMDNHRIQDVRIRHTEHGMGVSFKFETVRSDGHTKLNIEKIEKCVRRYIDSLPKW